MAFMSPVKVRLTDAIKFRQNASELGPVAFIKFGIIEAKVNVASMKCRCCKQRQETELIICTIAAPRDHYSTHERNLNESSHF